MESHIIILTQQEGKPIAKMEELVVLNEEGNVAIFSTSDDASDFKEENEIRGIVIELPIC